MTDYSGVANHLDLLVRILLLYVTGFGTANSTAKSNRVRLVILEQGTRSRRSNQSPWRYCNSSRTTVTCRERQVLGSSKLSSNVSIWQSSNRRSCSNLRCSTSSAV